VFGTPLPPRRPSTVIQSFKADPQDTESYSRYPSGYEHDRGRRGSQSGSVHSRGSSGRRSGSPASLRGVSLAPKEFVDSAPGTPVLRTNYSDPNLQDWSGIKAEHSRRTSFVSPNRRRCYHGLLEALGIEEGIDISACGSGESVRNSFSITVGMGWCVIETKAI